MNRNEAVKAARKFGVRRARRNVVKIWEQTRWMDTAAVCHGIETAAACLKDAGIEDVRIEYASADGKTSAGGWVLPVAWDAKEARLETGDRRNRIVLADRAVNPQNIALYSPPTPGGKWVEGEALSTPDPFKLKGRLKGKFLLLQDGVGSFDINEFAAEQGALAMIVVTDSRSGSAARYVNYTVPLDAKRRCIPCFTLTPDIGRSLSGMLEADPHLRLRARVKAKRYAGKLPMLTGSIGSGTPELYVCAHIDEIGALDNASGCGVAIEALRTLHQIDGARGFEPQQRCIRFFFSTEVRGQQAWLNCMGGAGNFAGGINLDMVGEKTGKGYPEMVFRMGFRQRPHFSGSILREAVRIADKEAGSLGAVEGKNFVSDGAFGVENDRCGHVSLEQKTGWTYHSSADTPALLRNHTLKWTGMATVAFLYKMSRMDNPEVLRLAKRIRTGACNAIRLRSENAAITGKKAVKELSALRVMLKRQNVPGHYMLPADYYRAGVNRKTGCWPGIEMEEKLAAHISAVEKDLSRLRPANRHKCSDSARKQADNIVPLRLFKGFLSFEDHVDKKSRNRLKRRLGMAPAWCTASWVWILPTFFRGKQTLAEIVDELASIGVDVDMAEAMKLTRYLVDIGYARLRPVLDGNAICRALRSVGVRKGSILMAHTSLSRFGYVRGGEKTMINALLNVLGPRGTLVTPTHSNSGLGTRPYDKKNSRSNTGAVTEYFRKMPGVLRSSHPTHSIAAYGPAAAELTDAHRVDQAPFARDGSWGRLYDMDGDVLLMCPVRNSTIFHVGETWENLPQKSLVTHALDDRGRRRDYVLPNGPWHVGHFEKTMSIPLTRKGIMKEARLGEDVIRCAPARAMADISVRVNRRNPLISIGSGGKCTCSYCEALKDGMGKRRSRRAHWGER